MKPVDSSSKSVQKKTVGYRFHPTDAELVGHFLNLKIHGNGNYNMPIADIKLCDFEPWDLPQHSKIKSEDQTWYFFCARDLKYSRSRRVNRTTKAGLWKITGKERKIKAVGSKKVIGTKRTLVFYKEGPNQKRDLKTEWIMHEYNYIPQGNFAVCKLKKKLDGKIRKHEPNKVPSASAGKISQRQQNEMASSSPSESVITVDSSSGECQPCTDKNSDFEYLNIEEITDVSTCDKGEQSCYAAFDFANPSENEVITNSVCNGSKSCQQWASGLEDQPPNDITAGSTYHYPLVYGEGEWSPLAGTPVYPYEKAHMSMPLVVDGLEINTTEASSLEVQGPPTFFDDLKTFIEPENMLSSAHSHL